MNEIIKTENLGFVYTENENLHIALDDINIEVYEGEFLVILGHNGSGKSTLAKQINALLLPSEGEVVVDGMNTKDESKTLDIHRSAGMVFQNPDNQLVATIVEEDVAFGPENLGVEPTEIRKRVDDALEMVNMTEFAHKSPHMLSGGQKQRIAIAGVLALNPKIIIFDESTSMLDPVGRKEVLETIKYLNKHEKKTVILITHFMEETEDADRVIVMNRTKVIATGKPMEIFERKDILAEAGLVMPFAVEISDKLKEESFDIKISRNIDELAEGIIKLKEDLR